MKRTLILICLSLFINCFLVAQNYEVITVKAGTKVKDYFPASQRYLYPDFMKGKVIFKNRIVTPAIFNCNLLTGEVEFIQSKDTLFFPGKKEIDLIVIARDTFYYHDGYMQMIHHGPLFVYIKRTTEVKNILKQGAMGTTNRSSASESYAFVQTGDLSIDLKPTEDMVLQRKDAYFFSSAGNEYISFNKKNILRNVPGKENNIRDFLKTNKVNWESRADLLKLADFVSSLLSENSTK
jgi:hypothetical protein